MNKILFIHAHLVIDDYREYIDGALLIEGERIKAVYPHSNHLPAILDAKIIDLEGNYLFPGFFDTHTHGRNGIDFDRCSPDDFLKAQDYYAKVGTTSFFPTLTGFARLAFVPENMRVHLEGPYVNPQYQGALNPQAEDLEILKAYSTKVAQMTVAPETTLAAYVIPLLRSWGSRIMVGHSAIDQDSLKELDYDGYTHLFNCMPPLNHHKGSILNVALERTDDHYIEIIADGVHVNKTVLDLLFSLKRHDRIMLISDSTSAAGLPDGDYLFLSEKCHKENGRFFRHKDGRLAGGVSSLADQVRILKELAIPNTSILAMTSLNAFRFYGLERHYGSLIKGKMADLVVLDQDYHLLQTYKGGCLINV